MQLLILYSPYYIFFKKILTLPDGRPRSLRHWNINFSFLPDANVRVTLRTGIFLSLFNCNLIRIQCLVNEVIGHIFFDLWLKQIFCRPSIHSFVPLSLDPVIMRLFTFTRSRPLVITRVRWSILPQPFVSALSESLLSKLESFGCLPRRISHTWVSSRTWPSLPSGCQWRKNPNSSTRKITFSSINPFS